MDRFYKFNLIDKGNNYVLEMDTENNITRNFDDKSLIKTLITTHNQILWRLEEIFSYDCTVQEVLNGFILKNERFEFIVPDNDKTDDISKAVRKKVMESKRKMNSNLGVVGVRDNRSLSNLKIDKNNKHLIDFKFNNGNVQLKVTKKDLKGNIISVEDVDKHNEIEDIVSFIAKDSLSVIYKNGVYSVLNGNNKLRFSDNFFNTEYSQLLRNLVKSKKVNKIINFNLRKALLTSLVLVTIPFGYNHLSSNSEAAVEDVVAVESEFDEEVVIIEDEVVFNDDEVVVIEDQVEQTLFDDNKLVDSVLSFGEIGEYFKGTVVPSFQERVLIFEENKGVSSVFNIGEKLDQSLSDMNKFINSDRGNIVFKYADQFGLDPYILFAKFMQEATLDHEGNLSNGGIGQHLKADGREVKAFNFLTGEYEYMNVTRNNINDFECNVKMSAMILQENMIEFHNNIYLALQSYNFGQGPVDVAVRIHYINRGITKEELHREYDYTDWMEEIKEINTDYYSIYNKLDSDGRNENTISLESIKDLHGKGDNNYISNVLGYYIGDTMYFKDVSTKEDMAFNLITGEMKVINNLVR